MISLRHVYRSYSTGEAVVHALDDLSLQIQPREFVAITGPSGCGKSTLLHLLGGLDRPTSGEIEVAGIPLHAADEKMLTQYRRHQLGLVFQFFNLLPTMTLQENVELPLLLQGVRPTEAAKRAAELLDLVELSPRLRHFPHQLSGGQMQRGALARALVHRPSLVLADEPTGNLDSENAARVLQVLRKIALHGSVTLLLVTHSTEVAAVASRQLQLLDGKLHSDHSSV
jgi:putative ABC transport system ATP-binding protein